MTIYDEVLKYLENVENFLKKTKNDFQRIDGNSADSEVKKAIQQVKQTVIDRIDAILNSISNIRNQLDQETTIGENTDLKAIEAMFQKMPKE